MQAYTGIAKSLRQVTVCYWQDQAVEPSTQRIAEGWLARPLRMWFTYENRLLEEVDM